MNSDGASTNGSWAGTGWPARLADSQVFPIAHAGNVRRYLGLDIATIGDRIKVNAWGVDAGVDSAQRWQPLAEVALAVEIDNDADLTITSLDLHTEPASIGDRIDLGSLEGRPLRRGFRSSTTPILAALHDELPAHASLLRSLLHDLPIAVVIRRSGDPPDQPFDELDQYTPPVDICAGHRKGGTLHQWVSVRGPRRLGIGPAANDLTNDMHPPGRHVNGREPRAPGTTSRRRWLQVAAHDTEWSIWSGFRDSVIERGDRSGTETVVHEYVVDVEADQVTTAITQIAATPVVLPAPECPEAAASAGWLTGVPLADVADEVRSRFSGIETCSHLNDTLWTLGLAHDLIAAAATTNPIETDPMEMNT